MKTMGMIGFTLFISIFFAVGFYLLYGGIKNLKAANQAKNWPVVEGKIIECSLVNHDDSEGTTYKADVEYSYVLFGNSYRGNQIAFGYTGSGSRKTHQEIVDKLLGTKTVLVRYDPTNVSNSVLSYGSNRSVLLQLIFGVTWLLFVTGFTVLWFMSALSDSSILNTLVTTK
jgi:hypothetical protein